jgi:uncharacterized protein
LPYLDQLLLFIISLIANMFSALAGGGAGLIQLPALIFLGLPFGIALATHKVASIALGIGATLRHLRSNRLERKFALFILACGLPGVIIGANIILHVPDKVAQLALGVLTMGLGIYSWLSPELGQQYNPVHRNTAGYLSGGLAIFIIGGLNGSLTSGTGLFVTLWLVRWFGLDYKSAVTYTLILVGLFWNATGAITLGVLTKIHWLWLPALLLGSFIGGYLGAHLAIVKGNQVIKRTYEVITFAVGLKLILG